MCALSHCIREKPDWWKKVKDGIFVEKWRREALQREEEEDLREPGRKLTPTMVSPLLLSMKGFSGQN